MRGMVELVRKLGRDEEGAALIEYTVLLGVLLVAVILTIGLVGTAGATVSLTRTQYSGGEISKREANLLSSDPNSNFEQS